MSEELDSTTATETVEAPATDTAPAETGSTATAEVTDSKEDHFISDQDLLNQIRQDPKLSHFEKKMQAAYTKRMQNAASWREKADLVDRFNSDPQTRKQILQQYRNELESQAATPQGQAPSTAGPPMPPDFVTAFKQNLPPELQWMAESQAKSVWAAQQMAMAPYIQQLQNQQASTRESQWDDLAGQLPPGWEEHEDEMADLLTFLESPHLRHPVYGSKLQLLYKLATGDATATTNAIERMQASARNRVNGRGGQGQRVENNLTDRIMKTRSIRDAVQLAGRAAMEDLEGKGARFE